MLLRAGIGNDTARRHRALLQGPQKAFIPVLFFVGCGFDLGERAGNTFERFLNRVVDGLTVSGHELILALPDVERSRLQRYLQHLIGCTTRMLDHAHGCVSDRFG